MKCKRVHFLVLMFASIITFGVSAQGNYDNSIRNDGNVSLSSRLDLPIINVSGQQLYYYLPTKNESLYAISKRFNIDFEKLLRFNSSITGEAKKGQPVYFPVEEITEIDAMTEREVEPLEYMVQYGDTPLKVARQFSTTVADIFKANEAIVDTAVLRPGDVIIVPAYSAYALRRFTVEQTPYIQNVRLVLIGDNESWEGVAGGQNVSVDLLQAMNPGVSSLKKNTWLGLPEIAMRDSKRAVIEYDKRELTPKGQQEILMEIRPKSQDEVFATVILAAPKSNRDIEFSRGFLTALKRIGKTAAKVHVKFVSAPSSVEELIQMPELADAQYIIGTYDKETPRELAAYALDNGKKMIGVFDVRDSLHYEFPNVYQMLATSEEFHEIACREILNLYPDAYFLFVGDVLKAKDQLATELMNRLNPENFDITNSLAEWSFAPAYGRKLVVYSLANTKEEIKNALSGIEVFRREDPMGADAVIIGRPSWIAFIESMEGAIRKAGVLVPSRFYFNPTTPQSQEFLKEFRDLFPTNGAPLRSTPTFSVMGYDLANYLFGDGQLPMLQLQFQYKQVPGAGYYNEYFELVDLNKGTSVNAQ